MPRVSKMPTPLKTYSKSQFRVPLGMVSLLYYELSLYPVFPLHLVVLLKRFLNPPGAVRVTRFILFHLGKVSEHVPSSIFSDIPRHYAPQTFPKDNSPRCHPFPLISNPVAN